MTFDSFSDLQKELPVTGVDAVEELPSTDIDQLYGQYVAAQTKKNWKFYIVSLIRLTDRRKTMILLGKNFLVSV